jgi:hypothetical protein
LTDIDEVLYGMYTHFKIHDGVVVEPYAIARSRSAENTQPAGRMITVEHPLDLGGLGHSPLHPVVTPRNKSGEQRYTFGFRFAGKNMPELPGLDFTIEPAWQFGKTEGLRPGDFDKRQQSYTETVGWTPLGLFPHDHTVPYSTGNTVSQTIQAFAIHAEVGYTFKNVPWTPRIGYAYSFASGDDKPNQGSSKTFDHLYPTGHAHNGYMDITGWQNIKDHQIHLNIKPTKKLVVDAKLHFMSLDESADALYSVAGGTGYGGGRGVNRWGSDSFVNNGGMLENVDNTLGQEIDLTVKYKLFKNFGVVAGYSHFFADDWIEDTGAGLDRGVDWAYLQTSVKF